MVHTVDPGTAELGCITLLQYRFTAFQSVRVDHAVYHDYAEDTWDK